MGASGLFSLSFLHSLLAGARSPLAVPAARDLRAHGRKKGPSDGRRGMWAARCASGDARVRRGGMVSPPRDVPCAGGLFLRGDVLGGWSGVPRGGWGEWGGTVSAMDGERGGDCSGPYVREARYLLRAGDEYREDDEGGGACRPDGYWGARSTGRRTRVVDMAPDCPASQRSRERGL